MQYLVNKVVLLVEYCRWKVFYVLKDGVELGSCPTPTLTVEVLASAGLFVKDKNVVKIVNINMLTKKEGFEFLILPCRFCLYNVVLELVVFESHS